MYGMESMQQEFRLYEAYEELCVPYCNQPENAKCNTKLVPIVEDITY
jgi:hypothetical protein